MILDALRKAWLEVSRHDRQPMKIVMSRKALSILKKHARGTALIQPPEKKLPKEFMFRGAECITRGKSRISDLRFTFEFADGEQETIECFGPPVSALIEGFKAE